MSAATRALTDRERQVLELAAEGFSDKEIGVKLGVSVYTVRGKLRVIYLKTGARNRTHAVALYRGGSAALPDCDQRANLSVLS